MKLLKVAEIAEVREGILLEQGRRCAICMDPLSPFVAQLDHNHTTGVIRGVLCRNCNGLEGKIKNLCNRGKRKYTIMWFLTRISSYWAKHEEPQTELLHPTYKTPDEKRLKINAKARKKRAESK